LKKAGRKTHTPEASRRKAPPAPSRSRTAAAAKATAVRPSRVGKASPAAKAKVPAKAVSVGKSAVPAKRAKVSPVAAVSKVATSAKALPTPKAAPAAKPVKVAKPRTPAGHVAPRKVSTPVTVMALHDGIIYGPVRSRRLGRSLGINLTPAHIKLCSFNCTYCQYGWSDQSQRSANPSMENWPAPAAVAKAVASALKSIRAQGDHIDRLTLAGHGEPTMHPKFKEVVHAIKKVRDDMAPGVPLTVLSNASTLERNDVRAALADLDERYMKLDAGDSASLRAVNGTVISFDQILKGLTMVPNIVVQAMFVKDRTGRIDNTGDLTIIRWTEALKKLKPQSVHIYTIDRTPAFPYLQPVPAARLREIQQRVKVVGIPCEVFGVPELVVPAVPAPDSCPRRAGIRRRACRTRGWFRGWRAVDSRGAEVRPLPGRFAGAARSAWHPRPCMPVPGRRAVRPQ
jgi:wyosine [tRNA(Phe)-imidazoG37] synthetase (radical SAM superfamily)